MWVLRVELDGEWEQCAFPTRNEALKVFASLTTDYSRLLSRASLRQEDYAALVTQEQSRAYHREWIQ